MSEDDMRRMLQEQTSARGGQSEWAERHGFSRQLINNIIAGRREVSPLVAEGLGYERIVVFRPLIKEVEPLA